MLLHCASDVETLSVNWHINIELWCVVCLPPSLLFYLFTEGLFFVLLSHLDFVCTAISETALYLLIWGLHCSLTASDFISNFFFCMDNLKNFTSIYYWSVECLCKAYRHFYFYLYLEKKEDPLHALFFSVLHPSHHSVFLDMAVMTFIHLCVSLCMLLPPYMTSKKR